MLFSCTVASRKFRRIAIEITAAGIEVEKVRPAFKPKYTFAAVNTNVMTIPMIRPRTVNSARIRSENSGSAAARSRYRHTRRRPRSRSFDKLRTIEGALSNRHSELVEESGVKG